MAEKAFIYTGFQSYIIVKYFDGATYVLSYDDEKFLWATDMEMAHPFLSQSHAHIFADLAEIDNYKLDILFSKTKKPEKAVPGLAKFGDTRGIPSRYGKVYKK